MKQITETKKWLETVVIARNICPFAKRVFDDGGIHFHVENSTDVETCLENLLDECARLDENEAIETTLLIYANAFADFDDYLDFVEIAQALLEAEDYEGIYQVASFHPNYCFEGSNENDAANYTNRSPYPMLHLLRESSLEKALENYPNPEEIPENNIKLTRDLGLQKMQAILAACYEK
ncbi:MAG: DUF1415 domain-containing protein [Methylococcales bacterium]|nr:DUF1415 domain-containing protein [Methylococcales bacterium]